MNIPIYAAAFRISVQLRATRQKSCTFQTQLSFCKNFRTSPPRICHVFIFFLNTNFFPACPYRFLMYAISACFSKSCTRRMRCKFSFHLWGKPESKWCCRYWGEQYVPEANESKLKGGAEMRGLKVLNWREISCEGWVVEVWYRAGVYLWLLRDKAAGLKSALEW